MNFRSMVQSNSTEGCAIAITADLGCGLSEARKAACVKLWSIRRPSIRQWAIWLVIAGLSAAALVCALLIRDFYQHERRAVEAATLHTAGALIQAVDGEFAGARASLLALAASPSLDNNGNLADFHTQMRAALADHPDLMAVLFDGAGRPLLHSKLGILPPSSQVPALPPESPPAVAPPGSPASHPGGGPAPAPAEPGPLAQPSGPQPASAGARHTPQLAPSGLWTDPLSGQAVVALGLPLAAHDAHGHTRRARQLALYLRPQRFAYLLEQHDLPAPHITVVLDRSGRIVARAPPVANFIGLHAPAALRAQVREVPAGLVTTRSLHGVPLVFAFSRSANTGWTVAIGQPLALWRALLWQSIRRAAGLTGLVFVLAVLGAWIASRRIAAAISALVEPALALGRGEAVRVPELGLREAQTVGEALEQTAHLIHERTAQRDQAERGERELRELKQALESKERLVRGIFEQAPDTMLLLAEDGRILNANPEAERKFGYSHEQLLGMTMEALMPAEQRARHAAQRQHYQGAPERRAMGAAVELQGERADGSRFPVEVMLSPLPTPEGLRVIATVRDISSRRQAEAQVRTLNKRLALATEAGGVGVWEDDLVHETCWCDSRTAALFQLDRDGPVKRWWQRIDPADAARVRGQFDTAVREHRPFVTEYAAILGDGSRHVLRMHATPSYDRIGRPERMTGISWDVTEVRQNEQALRAALRDKEILLKELYHRVKNNLQIVSSLLNLQARNLADASARAGLLESAARVRAIALVHEKLYQSGNLTSIALDGYLADLCQQLRHAANAPQRGIRFELALAPIEATLESCVPLGLILNELIMNSLQHAFPDGRAGQVTVRLQRLDGDQVELTVQDNGIGLPAEPKAERPSLGLTLVEALARQLNASLSTRNANGACTTLVFPIGAASVSASTARQEPAPREPVLDGTAVRGPAVHEPAPRAPVACDPMVRDLVAGDPVMLAPIPYQQA
jgi:PAS domain S-box-containing protein